MLIMWAFFVLLLVIGLFLLRITKPRAQVIVTCTREAIEQREHAIDKLVEDTVNSGTYLIFGDKRSCLDALKSFQEHLNYCSQKAGLDKRFIKERSKKLEKFRQTVLDYNKNFIR